MKRFIFLSLIPLGILILVAADTKSKRASDKQSLSKLQDYIGVWRGAGFVRRGSTQGAWLEQADWAWNFDNDRASIQFKAEKAKYLSAGILQTTMEPGKFQLVAKSKDGKQSIKYSGGLDENGKLVMVADQPKDGFPARISIRMVANGDRLIVLYERAAGNRFSRLAEVGYTRKGSNFGKGASFVECVVTGGKGTIPVTHNGKTYYVCCTGCRDAFNDDPEGILAEYRSRKAAEKDAKN